MARAQDLPALRRRRLATGAGTWLALVGIGILAAALTGRAGAADQRWVGVIAGAVVLVVGLLIAGWGRGGSGRRPVHVDTAELTVPLPVGMLSRVAVPLPYGAYFDGERIGLRTANVWVGIVGVVALLATAIGSGLAWASRGSLATAAPGLVCCLLGALLVGLAYLVGGTVLWMDGVGVYRDRLPSTRVQWLDVERITADDGGIFLHAAGKVSTALRHRPIDRFGIAPMTLEASAPDVLRLVQHLRAVVRDLADPQIFVERGD